MQWDPLGCTEMHWDVGCTGMHWDALRCTGTGVHWEGVGGPKTLGLGGMCGELSASAMDCDVGPWEGMGA